MEGNRIDPEGYAREVIAGNIPACKWVRLACERHFKDLERDDIEFDDEHAKHIINFFPAVVRHTIGKYRGKPLHLEPWQQFVIWQLFGWKKRDGRRRFKSSYISIPKKNGKTTFAAALSILFLVGLDEAAAEIYYAATTRKQAKIAFNEAHRMSRICPGIKDDLRAMRDSIEHKKSDSRAVALSREHGDATDGINPSFAVIDEFHAHKDSSLKDILKSGMIARDEPMEFIITTAGFNFDGPCHTFERTCQQILEGIKHDDSLFCIMYGIDEGDDWNEVDTWIKANPSLGAIFEIEDIRDEYVAAVNNGGRSEVNFKTKHLNRWVGSESVWISDEIIMNAPQNDDDLTGRECYGGLDLASVSDFTSFSLVFPIGDKLILKMFTWLPEDTVKDRNDLFYNDCVSGGLIETTPGNVTDYRAIRKRLNELHRKYKIKKIYYDRHNSTQIVTELTEDGLNMEGYSQLIPSMYHPTAEMERLILKGDFIHNGDPLFRWQMQNVVLVTNWEGWYKIDKRHKDKKVDGIVAAVMATGAWMHYKDDKIKPGATLISIPGKNDRTA